MQGYYELSSERPIGMGLGPIPWSKIQEYADRVGLDEENRAVFSRMVRALDNRYLKLEKVEQERKDARANTPGKQRRRR